MRRVRRLVREIHRRSLWQVLGVYLAGSWVALQVVEQLTEAAGLPEWVRPLSLALLVVGFPIVMATAVVQEGVGSGAEPDASPPDDDPTDRVLGTADPPEGPGPAFGGTEPGGADAAGPARAVAGRGRAAAHRRIFTWRNALLGGAGAFTLLGLVTAAYLAMRSAGIGPAGTLVAKGVLEERATILVADFQSDDANLARAATEAFRIDLSQSPVVRLAEPAFVSAALERMGRAGTERLEPALGRELALREGVPAIVTGEVTRAGGGYLLTARLVAADDGEPLLSARETAEDSTGILGALNELSKRMRERIGEPLRSVNAAPPLERVSTPSLEALRRYSLAIEALDIEGDVDRGVALLEEAVALDSAFAMAWRKIGVELGNRGTQRSRAVEAVSRAYAHRDRLTERERYLAIATYEQDVGGDLQAAIRAYERMLDLDPEDDYALNNLGVMHSILRNPLKAAEYYARSYEAAPTNALGLLNSAAALANQGRLEEARRALATAAERFPDNSLAELYRVGILSADGRYDSTDTLLRRVLADEAGGRFLRNVALQNHRDYAGVAGHVADFESRSEQLMGAHAAADQPGDYVRAAAQLAFFRSLTLGSPEGAVAALDGALERYPLERMDPLDRPYLELAAAYAWAERPREARDLLDEFEDQVEPRLRRTSREGDAGWHRAVGAVALAEGRFDDAIEAYRRGDRGQCRTCALPGLGEAYDRAGRADSAIAVLERLVSLPQSFRLGLDGLFAGPWGDRYFLPRSYERLGQLHDARDEFERAAKYYAMFVELWAEADRELRPRVRAAQERLEQIVAERG